MDRALREATELVRTRGSSMQVDAGPRLLRLRGWTRERTDAACARRACLSATVCGAHVQRRIRTRYLRAGYSVLTSQCSPRAHPGLNPAGGGWASKPATATCTATRTPSPVPTGASRRRPTTTGEALPLAPAACLLLTCTLTWQSVVQVSTLRLLHWRVGCLRLRRRRTAGREAFEYIHLHSKAGDHAICHVDAWALRLDMGANRAEQPS